MTTAACADFGGVSRGGAAPVDPAHYIVCQLEGRGHCSIPRWDHRLITAIQPALELWSKRHAGAHEAIFEIEDTVNDSTELRSVVIFDTESGQDAMPTPHARMRAERSGDRGRYCKGSTLTKA